MNAMNTGYPPAGWRRISTVEAHTCGEPLRVIVDGVPPIPGDTILAKRRHVSKHLDHLRRVLMWEPRGHADMYGALLTEPVTSDGDVGVLFMHNEGFSTMCGHGVIALTKVLLDTGRVEREGDEPEVKMDTPAGRVTAKACRRNGRVEEISFRNVPSFVLARDRTVQVPGVGDLRYDVAFGGAFYAIVRSEDLDVGLEGEAYRALIEKGRAVKKAVMEDLEIRHPEDEDLGFLYGTIVTGPARDPGRHSRNVCIFADGEVDRSPTGTGVSARAALLYARNRIALMEPFTVESILGTCMTGKVLEEAQVGEFPAVVPEVTASAHITGRCEWWIDPEDPLGTGYLLR